MPRRHERTLPVQMTSGHGSTWSHDCS